jgi:hypothetical protein
MLSDEEGIPRGISLARIIGMLRIPGPPYPSPTERDERFFSSLENEWRNINKSTQ